MQANNKKHEGDPPPQNPNRISLIYEDNTMVVGSVVKVQRRRTTSMAKHPPRAPVRPQRQSICSRRDHGGKASARWRTTSTTKHPPRVLKRPQRQSMCYSRDYNGKASAWTAAQRQSICQNYDHESGKAFAERGDWSDDSNKASATYKQTTTTTPNNY